MKINNTCHENICRTICFEILTEENAFKLKTYVKILNTVDLGNAIYSTLKELKGLSAEIVEVRLHRDRKRMNFYLFFPDSILMIDCLRNQRRNLMIQLSLY